MRHKGIDKEQTRQKIHEAASRGFRKHGYAGIGVDGLAKAAGVTSGAFYSHFGSKNAAFEIALAAGLDEVIEAFTQYYLGKPHRNNLECGCAMATLTSEVVRFDAKVHTVYEKKMMTIADRVADGLAGNSDDERRARAWAMLSVLIGGLNVVRAMKNPKVAEEIAETIKTAAIKTAGRTRVKNS